MMHRSRIDRCISAVVLVSTAVGSGRASAQHVDQSPPEHPEGWTLVWADEFDGPRLDPAKWRIEDAGVIKNAELQYYDPSDVLVREGQLVLRSRRQQIEDRRYSSGLVDTHRRFSQTFGRIEILARLPFGRGIWPALWMLPEDGSWPPEIDIMELLGHDPRTVHMTHHWGRWPNTQNDSQSFTGPDFSAGFHLFAIEWSPDRIVWFVDGVERASSETGIPQKPLYLILNTAVGGHWPGNPDATTTFPQEMLIEYVRVYTRSDANRRHLWVSGANGAITLEPPEGVYNDEQRVVIRAEPDFGYRFVGWEGDVPGDSPQLRLTMDRDRRVHALFEPDPDLPARLTASATASATSTEREGLGPDKAIDGRTGTRWSSAFADPQELMIDLGSPADIEIIRILWQDAHAGRYDLDVSVDGQEWRRLRTVEKTDSRPDLLKGLAVRGRYVRLICHDRATQWGCSIWEFEVYGSR